MSIRTPLDFYYGLIPGTYDKFGLMPWPEHLRPRELNKPVATATRTALIDAEGIVFLTLDNLDRMSIATTIERLISLLDRMDGDPDLELEDEHGGDIVDEPHDDDVFTGADSEYSMGWQDEGSQLHLSAGRDDLEAELGATEEIDQVRRLETIEAWFHPDGEPDLGWTGHGRGCYSGEPTDDREGDDERDCDLAGGSTDLEFDRGEYDGPDFIWGGNEDAHP